jgi:hypothetical protein
MSRTMERVAMVVKIPYHQVLIDLAATHNYQIRFLVHLVEDAAGLQGDEPATWLGMSTAENGLMLDILDALEAGQYPAPLPPEQGAAISANMDYIRAAEALGVARPQFEVLLDRQGLVRTRNPEQR